MTAAAGRRTRAKWIAILCALGAIAVGLIGVRQGVRFARESRAIEALRSKDVGERRAALRQLAELRSVRGVPAILSTMPSEEKLLRAFSRLDTPNDASWEELCARTVHDMGRSAVPVLRSRLRSPVAAERFWSVFILLRFAEGNPGELDPAFLGLLEDPDHDVRIMASSAVGLSAAKNQGLLEILVADLKRTDSPEGLRVVVADAIRTTARPVEARELLGVQEGNASLDGTHPSTEMTVTMRFAALALLETSEDSSEKNLWSSSLQALCAIRSRWSFGDLDLKESIQVVIRRGLAHETLSRRLTALVWIDEAYDLSFGNRTLPGDVLEILGPLLADENRGVREKAAEYLEQPGAVPVLLRVIATADPVGGPRAMEILESMDASEMQQATVERLSRALASKEPGLRRAAARVLARYHASGSVEASLLSPLLLDEDDEVVAESAAALSSSGKLGAEIFDARVLKLLGSTKPAPVRLAACRAAEGLGPKARKAVPALVVGAEGEDLELAAEAIEALASISPEESLPLSIRALGHESPSVRDAAVTALWTVGSSASSALPALRRLAEEEEDPEIATRATTLVRRLEAEAGRPSRVRR